MITIIAEAKPQTSERTSKNLQDSLDHPLTWNEVLTEPLPTSSSSSPSAVQAKASSQGGYYSAAHSSERRMSQERLTTAVDVSVFYNGESIALGKIRNVGGRGMFVETSAELDDTMHLQLCFTVMGNSRSTRHRIWGRVVHVSPKGVGIHLDVLQRDTLTGLQALKKQAARERRQRASSP